MHSDPCAFHVNLHHHLNLKYIPNVLKRYIFTHHSLLHCQHLVNVNTSLIYTSMNVFHHGLPARLSYIIFNWN